VGTTCCKASSCCAQTPTQAPTHIRIWPYPRSKSVSHCCRKVSWAPQCFKHCDAGRIWFSGILNIAQAPTRAAALGAAGLQDRCSNAASMPHTQTNAQHRHVQSQLWAVHQSRWGPVTRVMLAVFSHNKRRGVLGDEAAQVITHNTLCEASGTSHSQLKASVPTRCSPSNCNRSQPHSQSIALGHEGRCLEGTSQAGKPSNSWALLLLSRFKRPRRIHTPPNTPSDDTNNCKQRCPAKNRCNLKEL